MRTRRTSTTVLIAGQFAKRNGTLAYSREELARKQSDLAKSTQRIFEAGDYVHQAA